MAVPVTSTPAKTYVASPEYKFLYPSAGDPLPPGGAKVLLLTRGGVCIVGTWNDSGFFTAWAPLPSRNKSKESQQ